jgi:hypothetical protein
MPENIALIAGATASRLTDATSPMSRARAAGFTYYEDTEDRFLRHLDRDRQLKVLP